MYQSTSNQYIFFSHFAKQWILQLLSLKNPYIRHKLGLAPEKILNMRLPRENIMLENRDTLQPEILAESLSPEKLLDVSIQQLLYLSSWLLSPSYPFVFGYFYSSPLNTWLQAIKIKLFFY